MRGFVMTLLLLVALPANAQTGSLPSAAPASQKAAPAPAKSAADNAVQECMRLWDKATHMTKQEWSRTCKRIQTRLDNLKVDNLKIDKLDATKSARKKGGGG